MECVVVFRFFFFFQHQQIVVVLDVVACVQCVLNCLIIKECFFLFFGNGVMCFIFGGDMMLLL